jgi:Rrf2 family nitric oxide-sensitive transcriptional repressor
MQLTRYTDYSLRLLMLLGLRSDELLTIQRVSDAYGISRNHLVKIVNHLASLGFVQTNRGRKGGIRLAVAPEKIVVGHLVRELEPTLKIAECFDEEKNQCVIASACMLKPALRDALQAFLKVLDEYTLADLISSRRELGLSLGVSSRPPRVRVIRAAEAGLSSPAAMASLGG